LTPEPAGDGSGAGPLAGVRVLDVGTRISAPFCAGLLGELGAEVIKVEQPGTGDFMRTIGPFAEGPEGTGYSLFWAVEGRGRRSVTCDLRKAEGQELFRRLAAQADVLCENFRPGTMEEWGLGPGDLSTELVYVRISAFGQDGPYAQRPGLDRLGIAYGGLLQITGERDRPPVRPGVTISDYLTGVFAALAAVAGLYERRTASSASAPSVVDAALYESILRVLEWTLAAYAPTGRVRTREGNRMANSAPLDNYRAADGSYVCIVGGSDANFGRLCRAMGRTELISDPRYATLSARVERGQEINDLVAEWAAGLGAAEIEAACVEHGVPVGTAYTAADIFADPHMAARGDLVTIEDPVIGPVRQQAPFPRFVGRPAAVPSGAPELGAHNREVWCDLVGLSEEELKRLGDTGVV
jgi:crotonobetainyl-CoA:carnitine CoA-transferase CaiB-like acyl-CoA transferase